MADHRQLSMGARSQRAATWLIGVAATSALVGVGSAALTTGVASAAPVAAVVEVYRAAGSAGLQPAVRVAAPEAPTPVPVKAVDEPPVANVSSCRSTLPAAAPVATISVASISYRCPIFSGGQATMDAGAATWITDIASDPALSLVVGGAGTIWLGGHHSSHGGAFASVPNIADGAIIVLSDASGTSSYRVVGRAYVRVVGGLVVDRSGVPTNAATLDALLRSDRGGNLAPRLTIQTCDGENYRWMIYADLVVGS